MDTKKNIIFVGGIHGVGKTTICDKISNELSITHYSSSELISMLDSQRIRKDKKVENIQDNQNVLLESVKYFLLKDKIYLLDGHFCLIDSENFIKQVPIEVFESIGIKGIVIITDYEKKILERLKNRDNKNYSLEFIKRFQEKEIIYAGQISKQIKVPLKIINISNEKSDIISIIKRLAYGK